MSEKPNLRMTTRIVIALVVICVIVAILYFIGFDVFSGESVWW
ncbi:MAG: hypothetical protein Q7J82_03365 [Coriobacteriia bacterium]|nr:hypothetical protein [Coriobacteriia bacterium]